MPAEKLHDLEHLELTVVAKAAAVRRWSGNLRDDAPPTYRGGDESTVLAAVAQNGVALRFADAALRAKESVVLAAVAQHGVDRDRPAFLHVQRRAKRDRPGQDIGSARSRRR